MNPFAAITLDLSTAEVTGLILLSAALIKSFDAVVEMLKNRFRDPKKDTNGDATRREVVEAIRNHDKTEAQRIDTLKEIMLVQTRLLEKVADTQHSIDKSLAVLAALEADRPQDRWRVRDIRDLGGQS